ncbi:hypothetical protein HHK36_017202 [Tetracentron sinense]|uniref:Uncharacterized protein n=1 Tax=Tetracentron sinense TaxID=13715 RepID=A0A834Z2C7_TETSI|nr:hypothetical protein HHK36_017202 [Tetracentron sinense]
MGSPPTFVSWIHSLIMLKTLKELQSKGILLYYLGSDEQVANLFNRLSNNLLLNPHAYGKVKQQIEEPYKNNEFLELEKLAYREVEDDVRILPHGEGVLPNSAEIYGNHRTRIASPIVELPVVHMVRAVVGGQDLFLLENQLPFLVLEKDGDTHRLCDDEGKEGIEGRGEKPPHLLKLLPEETLGTFPSSNALSNGSWSSYRSVEELIAVGIEFKRSDTHRLCDVGYRPERFGGELSLPAIAIDDSTEHVKEQRSRGILHNSLGSDEQVADLFNQLSDNLVLDPHAYSDVKNDIENNYQSRGKHQARISYIFPVRLCVRTMDNLRLVSTTELSEKRKVVRQEADQTSTGFQGDESERQSVVITVEESSHSSTITKECGTSMKDGGQQGSNESKMTKIQKVPLMLRTLKNKDKYDPVVVSIGPYHHGNSKFELIQNLKDRIAKKLVEGNHKKMDKVRSKFVKKASNAREFYAEGSTTDFDDGAFMNMMFLDGCFVLHFIDCVANEKLKDMEMKLHYIVFVRQDLFLLENQLPFLVLKVLMDLIFEDRKRGWEIIKIFLEKEVKNPRSAKVSLLNYLINFLAPCLKKDRDTHRLCDDGGKEGIEGRGEKTPHLLQLLREETLGTFSSSNALSNGSWSSYRSVEELIAVGIEFKRSDTHRLCDVRYRSKRFGGQLSLPAIAIDDSTERKFLNLTAYETCPDGPEDYGVTSYICFMDSLIDNAKDVKELRSRGILHNSLGSDEQVADLFNQLSDNLVLDPHAYSKVKNDIENHYQSRGKIWMAEIKQTHFRNPWTIIAFFIAFLLLGLTITQTHFSVFPRK